MVGILWHLLVQICQTPNKLEKEWRNEQLLIGYEKFSHWWWCCFECLACLRTRKCWLCNLICRQEYFKISVVFSLFHAHNCVPPLSHPCFAENGLIYSISPIFISKIAPYFSKNHFILCMLKGLLSSANIFLIKAMLNGWAIARGKMHGWWRTKVTSEQQINYSLRKGAAIKDKVRPGVTHSFSDCVIHLQYNVVKAICWDLNTAILARNTRTR